MKKEYNIALTFCLSGFLFFGMGQVSGVSAGAFSNYSISKGVFNFIVSLLKPDQTLLELGSGSASGLLSKYINVYSVEHDYQWVNKYKSNYIYAPIVNGWYNTQILKEKLPNEYHLILVDGPTGSIGRQGFLHNLSLFNTDVPIIFDDVNRDDEYQLLIDVATVLGRKYAIYTSDSCNGNLFGIIFPKGRSE